MAEHVRAADDPKVDPGARRPDVVSIGVLGLGAMGLPIASTLHASGARLIGFDITAAARERATTAGLTVATDLAQLVHESDVIVLSLPTPAVVRDAVGAIVAAGASGRMVLDTSTIDPVTAEQSQAAVQDAGGDYADCPVLGRPAAVGRWTIPVGGTRQAFDAADAALAPVATTRVHVGPVGSALTVKILNNMMLATINAVTAEALVLAEAAGLDPGVFVDTVVDSGAASVSGLFREVAPRAVEGNFDPTFSVRLMHKDNALALELAERCGVSLSVATAAQESTATAIAAGQGEEDSIAVVKALEAASGHRARRH